MLKGIETDDENYVFKNVSIYDRRPTPEQQTQQATLKEVEDKNMDKEALKLAIEKERAKKEKKEAEGSESDDEEAP
jgi:hypothetical protein